MKVRIVEVYTPGGAFLLSQQNDRIICQGQGPDGVQEFSGISQLPESAKVPVFRASGRLSHIPHRFVSFDQSTANGAISYDCSYLTS